MVTSILVCLAYMEMILWRKLWKLSWNFYLLSLTAIYWYVVIHQCPIPRIMCQILLSVNGHNKRWNHWFKRWLFVNVSILFILVQEYPKLSQSYYALLEILAQDHMNFLSSLEPRVSIRKKHVFLWESKVCRVKTAINKWNQSKESFINLIV